MLCAGAVLLGLSLPAAADLTEASRLAEQDPARALAMANAVLVEDPDHIDALLIRARAEAAIGRPRAARQSALAAYRAADVQPAHYASAMILADLAGQDGNHTLAQYWLRRAVQHTQTDAEVAQVVRAYQHARRENPWAFQFSIGGAPNSNVNNGSSERIISIQGLPFVLSPTARALSGFSAEATAAVQYRFSRTTNSQSHIGLEVVGRMNWLDARSKAAAPGVTGHDFDYYAATVVGQHVQMLDARGTALTISGQAGRHWYGGTKLSDTFGAGLALGLALADGRDRLTLSARADRVFNERAGQAHETIGKISARYDLGLPWGDTLSGEIGYTKSQSTNPVQVYGKSELSLTYAFDEPIGGAIFTLGASYGYKDYGFSPYTTVGRQDHMFGVTASAELRNLSYMGFAPVVTLQANRSFSNVSLYSQQSLSGGLSLQSRF